MSMVTIIFIYIGNYKSHFITILNKVIISLIENSRKGNYNINTGRNYKINIGSNYKINTGSNYKINIGSNYKINTGSNYKVIIEPRDSLGMVLRWHESCLSSLIEKSR